MYEPVSLRVAIVTSCGAVSSHNRQDLIYSFVPTHYMYVISLSNISIKTNFKQITRVELKFVQYSHGDYILCMTSHYFSVNSSTSGYCVLSNILMICRRIKVVWQRTSCAASHHSFITSVVIQHLVSDTLYQACYFRSIQRKTYIMLDKILLIHLTQRAMLTIAITWCQSWSSVLHHKLFQRSSPLKLLHQLEPNLV